MYITLTEYARAGADAALPPESKAEAKGKDLIPINISSTHSYCTLLTKQSYSVTDEMHLR